MKLSPFISFQSDRILKVTKRRFLSEKVWASLVSLQLNCVYLLAFQNLFWLQRRRLLAEKKKEISQWKIYII